MSSSTDPSKKHDFMLVVEMTIGNPNGDPDLDNQPRQNFETDQGLLSDASTKRKVRNFTEDYFSDLPGYEIYVKEDCTLNSKIEKVCSEQGLVFDAEDAKKKKDKISKKYGEEAELQVRTSLLQKYVDLRLFGGVLTTGRDAGQVRGPIQILTGFSINPINPQEITISRKAITKEEDKDKSSTFGKKWIVPHAVYVIYGHYSSNDGFHGPRSTGVTQQDLENFYIALKNMYETERSAARGLMTMRGMYVFTHECKFGNAPAQVLFESIQVRSKTENPSKFSDYEVTLPTELPKGVTLDVMVG